MCIRDGPTAGRRERLGDGVEDGARGGRFAPRRSRLGDWCSFQAVCPLFGGEPPPAPPEGMARLLTARRAA